MKRTVIVSYARTPFGKFGGVLKELKAVDLGAIVLNEAIQRGSIDTESIDMVIMGQVLTGGCGQTGVDSGGYIATGTSGFH